MSFFPAVRDYRSELKEGVDYRIVDKSTSGFMAFLAKLLFFNKTFLTGYYTTIGTTIYAPGGTIPDDVLAHELQHIVDYKKFWWLFSISYLLWLPTVFTLRAFWEWRAYRVTLQWYFDRDRENIRAYIPWIVDQFIGPNYLWMYPFKGAVTSWCEKWISEMEAAASPAESKPTS